MVLKILKPVTPSQRGTVLVDKSELWKGKPYKKLVKGYISTGGRNNQGKITSRRMGGGAKRKYRMIDFKRDKKIVGKPIKSDKHKGKPTLVNLLGYKKTLNFANNLKNKIKKKIKNYGIKSQDLLQSVEFILERKF